jgi:hypothetical protein
MSAGMARTLQLGHPVAFIQCFALNRLLGIFHKNKSLTPAAETKKPRIINRGGGVHKLL